MKLKHWLFTFSLLVVLLSSCTSLSQPPLSEEEALFQEVIHSDAQFTSNGGNCDKILETEPWCSVVLSVTKIVRPEWVDLFPTTKFFLVNRNVLGHETGFQRNWLIAKQNERQFTAEAFDQILATNSITITDDNRELVAKALVLMTLPDYLQEEITFSDSKVIDEPGVFSWERFNYTITAWTKLQGLKIPYFFFFQQGHLRNVLWKTREYGTGAYIDVPSAKLSPFQQGEIRNPY